MAELVDALVLGTSGVTCESSSLSFRINLRLLAKFFNSVTQQIKLAAGVYPANGILFKVVCHQITPFKLNQPR